MSTVSTSVHGVVAFTKADHSLFASALAGTPELAKTADASGRSWAEVLDHLLRIHKLEDDWDGEGTAAPHPNLVDGAIALAQYLDAKGEPPADRAFPSVNGTIYFEWHTPLGYQEIEVTSPLDAECRWVPKGSTETVVVSLSRRP